MDGLANMRVHANLNYSNTNYALRLTDIYILKVSKGFAYIELRFNTFSFYSARIGMPPMALTMRISHALPSSWPEVPPWRYYHS